jgi:hypothetical protein
LQPEKNTKRTKIKKAQSKDNDRKKHKVEKSTVIYSLQQRQWIEIFNVELEKKSVHKKKFYFLCITFASRVV